MDLRSLKATCLAAGHGRLEGVLRADLIPAEPIKIPSILIGSCDAIGGLLYHSILPNGLMCLEKNTFGIGLSAEDCYVFSFAMGAEASVGAQATTASKTREGMRKLFRNLYLY